VTAKEISITEDDDGAPLATVDRTNWLSASLGRFRQPRRIILPRDVSHEYQEHLKAPVRTYEREKKDTKKDQQAKSGNNVVATFVSTGPDHFAHARTYAEIALPLVAARETNQDIKSFL